MYYQKENRFIFIDGSTSVTFTSEDAEGFYQAYLAWVAEGNTPEEWVGM
jgi:hypothetical protein